MREWKRVCIVQLIGWVDVGSSHSEDIHFVTDTEDLLNVKATAVVSKSALISETPAWNSLKVGASFCFFRV